MFIKQQTVMVKGARLDFVDREEGGYVDIHLPAGTIQVVRFYSDGTVRSIGELPSYGPRATNGTGQPAANGG